MNGILDNVPAAVAGFVAAFCLVAAPLLRSRSGMLTMQFGAGLAFAIHYAFLGVPVASGVNILGAVQTGAAIFAARNAALNRIGYALIPLMIAVGLYYWTGPVSAFSVTAMGLIALGRMQTSQPLLRSLVLAGGCFWMLHDFMIGAWIALAADVGTWITGAIGLAALYVRLTFEWRSEVPASGAVISRPALAMSQAGLGAGTRQIPCDAEMPAAAMPRDQYRHQRPIGHHAS